MTTFPTPSRKWRISNQGGTRPRWRGDGREIYFIDAHDNMAAVDVNGTSADFSVGAPRILFHTHPLWLASTFDVTGDGQTFLVNTVNAQLVESPANLVLNWPEQLKRK